MEIKKAIEILKDFDKQATAKADGAYQTDDGKTACDMGIIALRKQMPKKPIMKPFYEDMKEEYLCCPTCGDILTDRIPMDNSKFYFHCLNCGQKFDWSDDNG